MKKLLLIMAIVLSAAGSAAAENVYMFPDGRVQWNANVYATPVPLSSLSPEHQSALLAQRASYPTVRERLAHIPPRPQPLQYVDGVPTRSGVIPSALRHPAYQPQQSVGGPQVNVGLQVGLGPLSIGISF
jgi:hypothetical protein